MAAAINGITHTGSLITSALTGLWDSPAGLPATHDALAQLNTGLAALALGTREKTRRAENVDRALTLQVSAGVSPDDVKMRRERRKVLAYMPRR